MAAPAPFFALYADAVIMLQMAHQYSYRQEMMHLGMPAVPVATPPLLRAFFQLPPVLGSHEVLERFAALQDYLTVLMDPGATSKLLESLPPRTPADEARRAALEPGWRAARRAFAAAREELLAGDEDDYGALFRLSEQLLYDGYRMVRGEPPEPCPLLSGAAVAAEGDAELLRACEVYNDLQAGLFEVLEKSHTVA